MTKGDGNTFSCRTYGETGRVTFDMETVTKVKVTSVLDGRDPTKSYARYTVYLSDGDSLTIDRKDDVINFADFLRFYRFIGVDEYDRHMETICGKSPPREQLPEQSKRVLEPDAA